MARTPDGPAPPPAVQRLRLRYAKRGRLRFSSHRDFQRAFERALRRAGVPMAYSGGFTPHPKISYANSVATGVASEAEYVEVAVADRVDPHALRGALDAALPPGLDVLEVVEATGAGPLADRLEASRYEVVLPEVGEPVARAAVEALLAASEVRVERLTKNGVRAFDARAAVFTLRAAPGGSEGDGCGCAILDLVVRHVTPAVRPDDVLAGLRQVADLVPPVPPVVTRLAQGPLDRSAGTIGDPLAVDRDSVGAAERAGA